MDLIPPESFLLLRRYSLGGFDGYYFDRYLIKATYRSGRQAQGERGLIRVILFKMLVLQQLFVMTGEEIEFQFNGRRLLLPLLSTVLISFSRSVASLVAIYVHRASAKVQLSVVF